MRQIGKIPVWTELSSDINKLTEKMLKDIQKTVNQTVRAINVSLQENSETENNLMVILFIKYFPYPVFQLIRIKRLFDIINRPHFMRVFYVFRIV
ncbi:hypothetical protein R84B8_02813 [Treponema sp. R8-4-B8]